MAAATAASTSSSSMYDVRSSPFIELKTPFTAYEAFKMVLLLPLVPIRLLVAVLACSVIAVINTFAASNWPLTKPLPKARRDWVLFSKEIFIVALWMLGFRVKVTGREHVKRAEQLGSVIVFNHVSYVDAPLVMWLFAPSGVGKSSVSNVPILKHVVKAYQAVYFHESRKPAAAADAAAAPAAAAPSDNTGKLAYIVTGSVTEVLMKRVGDPCYGQPGGYPMVAMAPEGTCGDGRGLLEFRTGAFVLGRPVLPVCIKYRADRHNPAWTQVTITSGSSCGRREGGRGRRATAEVGEVGERAAGVEAGRWAGRVGLPDGRAHCPTCGCGHTTFEYPRMHRLCALALSNT